MDTVELTVWALVDEGGDYVATHDPDTLHEVYDEVIGGDRDTLNMLRIKLTIMVQKPKPIELTGVIPAEANIGELKVA